MFMKKLLLVVALSVGCFDVEYSDIDAGIEYADLVDSDNSECYTENNVDLLRFDNIRSVESCGSWFLFVGYEYKCIDFHFCALNFSVNYPRYRRDYCLECTDSSSMCADYFESWLCCEDVYDSPWKASLRMQICDNVKRMF